VTQQLPRFPLKQLDRWQICLIIAALAYGGSLLAIIPANSLMWDEVTHLHGGLLLSRGQAITWALTNSFYPPAFDVFAALSFLVFGPSLWAARLVSVVFAGLSLFVIYELANLLCNSKRVALGAAVLFAIMPGIIWVAKMAMIETLLIFTVSLSMLFFFRWLKNSQEKDRVLFVATFVFGVLVKYQLIVVIPLIAVLGTYFWKRDYFHGELKKWFTLPRIAILAAALVAATIITYVLFSSKTLDFLIYAFSVGSEQKTTYSTRYPIPIFYFAEMTWVTELFHPISLLLYLTGLAGLGLMVYRRKTGDKFLLLWFTVVYVVFTLVSNREWRYLTVAFPVLAIAASSLIAASWSKLRGISQKATSSLSKWGARAGTVILVAFVVSGGFLSAVDAYNWVAHDRVDVPVEQASIYAGQNLGANQTLVVLAPVNHFSKYMVSFYLSTRDTTRDFNQTCLQYPASAMDTFASGFNVSELVSLCQESNVKYALLYEYGGLRYFESSLSAPQVYDLLNATEKFSLEASFGVEPHRIFVFSFDDTV
jgi:4-amino-4-deoxy-L-arabinose transferase-like glycosyltransferase